MEMLLRYGADADPVTYHGGSAAMFATAFEMWDIVEFLLRHGADLTHKNSHKGGDSFVVAAKGAGISWEPSETLDRYLTWLNDPTATPADNGQPPIPSEARKNPLANMVLNLKGIQTRTSIQVVGSTEWLSGET